MVIRLNNYIHKMIQKKETKNKFSLKDFFSIRACKFKVLFVIIIFTKRTFEYSMLLLKNEASLNRNYLKHCCANSHVYNVPLQIYQIKKETIQKMSVKFIARKILDCVVNAGTSSNCFFFILNFFYRNRDRNRH